MSNVRDGYCHFDQGLEAGLELSFPPSSEWITTK